LHIVARLFVRLLGGFAKQAVCNRREAEGTSVRLMHTGEHKEVTREAAFRSD
jgi:hypothetical protein